MKEQSHKDEMSAALRGDFARLRERGVSTTLAPPEERSDDAAEPIPEVAAEPVGPAPDETPPGWLGRLFTR